jgi:hypothetical protein
MTGPVAPSLAAPMVPAVGHQVLAESSPEPAQNRACDQPIGATVLSSTRQGLLIEAGGQRFLMTGAPPLPDGESISLELARAGRQATGRLLAIAGRGLEAPVMTRLALLPPPARSPGAVESGPERVGVEVEARLLGPEGRPAGPPISIRLAAAGEPPPDAPGAPHFSGSALSAEVIGSDPAGRALVRAAGLMLRLETTVDVPPGARLQLVLPAGIGARSSRQAPEEADLLRRALGTLLGPAGTADSASPIGLRLPAANHALAARLLTWINALSRDAGPSDSAAPGSAPDAPPGIGAPRDVLHEPAPQARAAQVGAWRVLVMPFGVQDPTPLRLYLRELPSRHERGTGAGRERRSGASRAIFAVEFSEFGQCQLDLLCQTRRFDLAVRTERPLPAALQDDIKGLLGAACEIAGVASSCEFRPAELLSLPDAVAPSARNFVA